MLIAGLDFYLGDPEGWSLRPDLSRCASQFSHQHTDNGQKYADAAIAYAAVDPSRAVGVMGDKRVYGYVRDSDPLRDRLR